MVSARSLVHTNNVYERNTTSLLQCVALACLLGILAQCFSARVLPGCNTQIDFQTRYSRIYSAFDATLCADSIVQ